MIDKYKIDLIENDNLSLKCPMPGYNDQICNSKAEYMVQGTMLCSFHAKEDMRIKNSLQHHQVLRLSSWTVYATFSFCAVSWKKDCR